MKNSNKELASKDKLTNMKKAGYISATIHEKLKDFIKPGVKLLDIDKLAYDIITKHNAKPNFLNYKEYPYTTCISVNDQVVHSAPTEYALKEGDIVTVDLGCSYNGWHSDVARTYAVGPISHDKQKLMDVTKTALEKALAIVKEGVRVGEISTTISDYVHSQGMSIPVEFCGHGIGENLHEAPLIPNTSVDKNYGQILKAGDTVAIEPIVHFGKKEITIDEDNWTVTTVDGSDAAHEENTILITKKGYVILTSLDQKEIING